MKDFTIHNIIIKNIRKTNEDNQNILIFDSSFTKLRENKQYNLVNHKAKCNTIVEFKTLLHSLNFQTFSDMLINNTIFEFKNQNIDSKLIKELIVERYKSIFINYFSRNRSEEERINKLREYLSQNNRKTLIDNFNKGMSISRYSKTLEQYLFEEEFKVKNFKRLENFEDINLCIHFLINNRRFTITNLLVDLQIKNIIITRNNLISLLNELVIKNEIISIQETFSTSCYYRKENQYELNSEDEKRIFNEVGLNYK